MANTSNLENKVRRVVGARLRRGDRGACALAVGHQAPWITKWLKADLHATVDEMDLMARYVGLSLAKIISAPDAAEIDWEVFAMMARVEDKQLARDLIAGIADHSVTVVAKARSASPTRGRRAADRGAHRRAG